jgi:cyanophycinase
MSLDKSVITLAATRANARTRARDLCLPVSIVVMLGTAYGARAIEPARSSPPRAENTSGALVIVGGGLLPDAVRDRFIQLAGGKNARIVVIPTASIKADYPELLKSWAFWKAQDVKSVELLHTRDRARANDPAFVKLLKEATGVWIAGGDQALLVAAYHGTAVERELEKLVARGGVIGGTSAGAAVMSTLMIVGGNPSARVGSGFGLLPGVVIDQHFQNRHRLDRLMGVLAKHPECPGLGIDEQTALVIKGHVATVLGTANVRVCLCASGGMPASVKVLKAGEEIDLTALTRSALDRLRTVSARPATGGSVPTTPTALMP